MMYKKLISQPPHPIVKNIINNAGIANRNEKAKIKLCTNEEPGYINSKRHSAKYIRPKNRLIKKTRFFLSSAIVSPA